jgi:outer membrane protein assembly factor BamE
MAIRAANGIISGSGRHEIILNYELLMRKTIILAALFLAACSHFPVLTPYKINVQQGNVVTQEMVSKLWPGLTKAQVRFVLGTPLLTDIFNPERWDYVYLYEKRGVLTKRRRVTLLFEGDALKRIEGDVVPAHQGKAKTDAKIPAPAVKGATPEGKPASGR